MKKIIYIIAIGLMLIGCGGGDSSGSSSSFSTSDNAPIFEEVTTDSENYGVEQNETDIVAYVKENTKNAFKVKAKDKSNITFRLSEGDFSSFIIDPINGEVFFREFTDYEKKSIYKFKVVIADTVNHKTIKDVTIYIGDVKNEPAPIVVVNSNTPLSTNDERKYFITTWKTDNNATLHPKQITIPIIGDGYLYNVDWVDGTSSKDVIEDITHIYKTAGTYRVKISGKFPRIYFGKGDKYGFALFLDENNFKIISIDQWGEIEWSSMASAFLGCQNLQGQAVDSPNLSHVKNMKAMYIKYKKGKSYAKI